MFPTRGPCGPDSTPFFFSNGFLCLHVTELPSLVVYLGPGAQQKAKERGKEERSEQTSEEGYRSAQQCSFQRGDPQRGRTEEATG